MLETMVSREIEFMPLGLETRGFPLIFYLFVSSENFEHNGVEWNGGYHFGGFSGRER